MTLPAQNDKLTDDEERAKGLRLGKSGQPRSSSFGRASCSPLLSSSEKFLEKCRLHKIVESDSQGLVMVVAGELPGQFNWNAEISAFIFSLLPNPILNLSENSGRLTVNQQAIARLVTIANTPNLMAIIPTRCSADPNALLDKARNDLTTS